MLHVLRIGTDCKERRGGLSAVRIQKLAFLSLFYTPAYDTLLDRHDTKMCNVYLYIYIYIYNHKHS